MNLPDNYPFITQDIYPDEIYELACLRFKTETPTQKQLEEIYQEKNGDNINY